MEGQEKVLKDKKQDSFSRDDINPGTNLHSTSKGMYKVVLNKNLRFEYGGIFYDLKKGKVYEVSEDLRELLKRGGNLEVY